MRPRGYAGRRTEPPLEGCRPPDPWKAVSQFPLSELPARSIKTAKGYRRVLLSSMLPRRASATAKQLGPSSAIASESKGIFMSNQKRPVGPRLVLQLAVFVFVVPFLPLLITGDWDWLEAWLFAVIYLLGFGISRTLAARRHPDILAERARFTEHADAAKWDKVLAPMVGLGGATLPLVSGLDALLSWSPSLSTTVQILALLAILCGYALSSYALIANRFFSGMVRIQRDRGHRVVSDGPYRWVRHPGYAGALLAYLATPFFLEALWALLPAGILTALLIVRTHLEDRTLRRHLDGYEIYAHRVRYRLIPGFW